MSGDGKRSVAEWPKLPRPSSTLPTETPRRGFEFHLRRLSGSVMDNARGPGLTPSSCFEAPREEVSIDAIDGASAGITRRRHEATELTLHELGKANRRSNFRPH